jgi:hypothetical protein
VAGFSRQYFLQQNHIQILLARTAATGAQSKLVKEMQGSERVILEVQQLFRNLNDPATFATVTPTVLKNVQNRLKSRLTPSLVHVYSQGYDPSVSNNITDGMKTLENLRESERTISNVEPLVAAVQNKSFSGKELLCKSAEAECEGFKCPAKLIELAIQRDLEKAWTAQNFVDFAAVLSVGEEAGDLLNISRICADNERAEFQDREMTKACSSLLREEGKVEVLKVLLAAFEGVTVLSSGPQPGYTHHLHSRGLPKALPGEQGEVVDMDKRFHIHHFPMFLGECLGEAIGMAVLYIRVAQKGRLTASIPRSCSCVCCWTQ